MHTALRRLAALTLPLAFAGIAACDSEVDDAMEEAATEQALDSITAAMPQATEPVATTADNRIAVTLQEWAIRMPETLAPGSYTFEVANAGSVAHAFEIEGARDEWTTDELAPGATTTITAELSPGTYTVYCPVRSDAGEHAELGMRRSLIVR